MELATLKVSQISERHLYSKGHGCKKNATRAQGQQAVQLVRRLEAVFIADPFEAHRDT